MQVDEFFRARISGMISGGFAVEAVRDRLDFAGVSELWGGPAYDDRPAWYFWMANMRGAYQLRLQGYGSALDDPALMRAICSIKYYPSPLEPVFRYFSRQERRWARSDAFDETGTPKLGLADTIPDSLFQVGVLEFWRDLRSQQSLLDFSVDGFRACVAPAAVGHLPAWDLGYPLFDSLVGLESFLSRQAPKRVIMEFRNKTEGRAPNDAKRVSVLFSPEASRGDSSLEAALMVSAPQNPGVADYACECCSTGDSGSDAGQLCGHDKLSFHDGAPETECRLPESSTEEVHFRHVRVGDQVWRAPLAFNALWWTLSQAKLDGALSCCCH